MAPPAFPLLSDPEMARVLSFLPPWKDRAGKEGPSPRAQPPSLAASWSKEAAVVRFCILERSPGDGLVPYGFLLDPDRRLRRAAIERLQGAPRVARGDAAQARRILEIAAPFLDDEPRRAAVFAAHGIDPAGPPAAASGADVEAILRSLERGASPFLSDPALEGLRTTAARAAEKGLDVVLLIDVTRSMDAVIEPLERAALWLFPAIAWTFPGARLGLVLYRDAVETTSAFARADAEELVRVLRDARAEGGGDVPEGVHHAVEAALSLGRFAWRPDAEKHLIIVGDAPPPYVEVKPLLSLVGRAFHEAGYHVHAVSVRPDEGRPAVPFFPEIAREGGGRHVTVMEPERLGEEIYWLLLPSDALEALRPLAGPLKSLFAFVER
jgi:hypothetical protein